MNIIFVGFSPRKISKDFLSRIVKRKSKYNFYHFLSLSELEIFLNSSCEEISFVFPIYCEDSDLKRASLYVDFAEQVEDACSKYENVRIFHSSFLGKKLGNKSNTNKYFSSLGIKMPKMIDDECGSMLFINDNEGSGSKTKISTVPEPLKYNTKFIKSVFKFNGENYYFCPRALCVSGKINEIYLRFRHSSDKNACVHGKQTPMIADLHNNCYDQLIKPNLHQLQNICNKLGEYMGLGFYAHDFLLENGSNLFYLSETSFKFDNKVWKNMNKSIVNKLTHEVEFSTSLDRSFELLEEEIEKNL